jgi:CO/xanthine dehydrogenase Mo-binding subunit
VPVRELHGDHRGGATGRGRDGRGEGEGVMADSSRMQNVFGARLSRRQFVKAGGALVVGVGLAGTDFFTKGIEAAAPTTLDPALPLSWIEIHPDNTILIRTGKPDFGQGSAFTAYRQIVAEELYASIDSITTVMSGDTDRTPDGSGAFDYLGQGSPNVRKVAAYTYQALLDLAATRLGAPKDQLSVKDGIVSGGGKRVSYGDLVKDQQLKLTIPVRGNLTSFVGLSVTGNPPLKPVSQYTVVGKSIPNTVTSSKVAAKEQWATDVRLPGMLHGRMVHPKTLGSTLVSAGQIDKKRFPNAQLVVQGNMVGVVAPTEWEAIRAAQQVATDTKWTDWKGLPGHDKFHAYLRQEADFKSTPVVKARKAKGDVGSALAGAAKTVKASYEMPFMKHAPMGPTMAVGDVRTDGTVHVHTHTQNPQALRGQIAKMLGVPVEQVVVRSYPGPGHYGRSNGGNAGAEDEAVLLSKAVGKPVRVQWMRPEDFQWSTQSSAGYSDVEIGLDAKGKIVGYQVNHYTTPMQDDRPIGAVLAGLPTMTPPDLRPPPDFPLGSTMNISQDPWVYDAVPNVIENGHGTFQIGQKASPIAVGLRDHGMRTPFQFQQNHPRELAMSEAAALAGADPIQFRIDHATDERVIGVLKAVREASGWETRPSPRQGAVATGTGAVRGQGVSMMFRMGTYWACVCQIAVTPSTGAIKIEKYTIAVEPGIVINPIQLKRQVEGGAVMGISHALFEEATFDESSVTSRDWRTYPIAKMGDIPEIKVVLIHKPEIGTYGGGSEAANALAAPAIAAALFDATGKMARRLPLRPANVLAALKA